MPDKSFNAGVNFVMKILKACLKPEEYDKVKKKINDALWEELTK